MNLFLASQVQDVTLQKFINLSGKDPQDLSLCFIPTAGNLQGKELAERGSWQAINKLKFKTTVLDLAGKTQEEVASALSDIDVVVMNGGNTFYLLDQVRKSGTDVEIKRFLEGGGWYIGSSAGSILAAPDIGYVAPMDSPELASDLKDYKGLSLVDARIVPHVGNPKYASGVSAVISQYSGTDELLKLSDDQALLVTDAKQKVI